MHKIVLPTILSLVLLTFGAAPAPVAAQNISSIAISIPITGDVKDGNIVCSDQNGYSLCNKEYQSSIYGIVTLNPSISINNTAAGMYAVSTVGIVNVLVSGKNGNIKKGDLITTSTDSGVGEKATKNGFVLGSADQDYSPANPTDTALMAVAINIHQTVDLADFRTNLLSVLQNGLTGITLSPIAILRYLAAAIMVIISFVLGFVYFGRVTKAGVEAIGRNPIARGTIQSSIVFHIVLTLGIAAVGLIIAYLILVL